MNHKIRAGKLINTIVMFIIGLFFLSPFLWMLTTSFKLETDVFNFPIEWIPSTWNVWENYKEVWIGGTTSFYFYYLNSIKVAVLTTISSVIVSSLAAYSFAKLNYKGKDLMFLVVLATFMVPTQSIFVPQFILFRWLGLYDTHLGLVLLQSFSVLGTFMLRQFFMGVHNELLESAKMDGAGYIKTFIRIALPITMPAIATYGILRFIWTWNDYQMPFIFLRSEKLFTLQLGMRQFADAHGAFYSLQMAAAVSAIIPLFIIFLIGQKQVIKGIQVGGVKG